MKKLDNFANCLAILANADFKLAEFFDEHGTEYPVWRELEAEAGWYLN